MATARHSAAAHPHPATAAITFVADLGAHRPDSAGKSDGDRDVPYLPTDQHVVNKMLEMAKVTKGDYLFDLGCGDGRIVITAAKLGARALGIDIDLERLRECHHNLRNTELKSLIEFRRQSFFDIDLRPATVVALYLLPAINRRLRPKLLWELRPGTRIIANQFEIADWLPDEKIDFKHRPVMLWIVPAWVEGNYRCFFQTPAGRFHGQLTLRRQFQFLRGELRIARKIYPLTGRVRGTHVRLDLPPGLPHHLPQKLTAQATPRHLTSGVAEHPERSIIWAAIRQ